MTHLGDDDLVLHYYGEDGRDALATERHLGECAQCARAYEALSRSLDAVTPPEFVEAIDELPALRQMLRDRLNEQSPRLHGRSRSMPRREAGVLALVWLVSLVYPFSLQALFETARWAHAHAAVAPILALTFAWACGGPLLAVWALNSTPVDRIGRVSTRLLVVGALLTAVSPALFLLVSRVDVRLALNAGRWSWYGALALGALVGLFRWPGNGPSTRRFVRVHRLSALLLAVFVMGHVVNQALAFVSPGSYAAMRSVMRLASQQPVSYTLIVAAVAVQIVTGAVTGMKNVRAGAFARNLQAVSGWYLAAFLLMHVFSGLVLSVPQAATVAAPPIDSFDLLASPRSVAQLPFLLLGVAAFLFHVGVYARLAALAYLAETSVRRLSYAGAVVGAAVVVAVGFSLCGVHL